MENFVRTEEEKWKKQKAAEIYFARYRPCGRNRCVEVWDQLMDDMEERITVSISRRGGDENDGRTAPTNYWRRRQNDCDR